VAFPLIAESLVCLMPEHQFPRVALQFCRQSMANARRFAAVAVLYSLLHTAAFAQSAPPTPVAPAKAQEAAAAFQRGDIDQALLLYNAALDDTSISNDRRAVLLTERGVATMKRRNFKMALEDFNKAAALYPEYAAVYVNRGSLLLMIGQPADTIREAIKDFDRAIVLSPALAAAFGNRGAAYLKLGGYDAAIADFTKAIELQPQNPAALNGRGRARLLAGRVHAASRDFSRAVAINPGFAQSYRNRAEAQMRVGAYREAAEDISRTLAFDARRVEDYLARGQAYLAADNSAAALTDFTKVVELDPKSVSGYIGMGFAKARTDATEEALNDLAQALEIDPRSARAYAVRAWIYKKRQQPELGEKDVERAMRLEPATSDAFWAQGELKEAAGDKDSAVAAFSRALGLDIRHVEALAALARLGYQPQTDEVPVTGGGAEGWSIVLAGELFLASHPQFPNLRIPLEMLGTGTPKILSFERQKGAFSGFGVLQFASGVLQNAVGAELVETAAVLDLNANQVVAMPILKIGTRVGNLVWEENRVVAIGADGLREVATLRSRSAGEGKETPRGEIASAQPAVRRSEGSGSASPAPKPTSGGQPTWSPWNQGVTGGASSPPREASTRPSPAPRKPKSLFDLIFGN
jgi:tetratricopeptide (TPR) repeat protein